MKKNIRTGILAFALVLAAAVTMPSAALPSQSVAGAQPASVLVTPLGYQSTPGYAAAVPFGECEHITHKNFCYCTGNCRPVA
jgi:hypothetical protein